MNTWRRTTINGLAALAAVLLGAASVAGIDQMANTHPLNPTKVAGPASSASQPSLHHQVLIGLAKGSLPGGYPYDELREEENDENYHETLFVPPSPA